MSPDKASADRGSSKSRAADWDIACFNCSRYGTFPGQMMTDAFNRTFCSPDCGWSYVLRPSEEARAAKAMRALQIARANQQHQNNHQRRSRSKRVSRQAFMAHQLRGQAHLDHLSDKHSKVESRMSNSANPGSPSSAGKPPRGPSSASCCPPPPASSSSSKSGQDRRADTGRRPPSKRYVSNAMFEYSMAYQNMSLDT